TPPLHGRGAAAASHSIQGCPQALPSHVGELLSPPILCRDVRRSSPHLHGRGAAVASHSIQGCPKELTSHGRGAAAASHSIQGCPEELPSHVGEGQGWGH
ncbi:MAG: hypothetical protein IJ546_00810, partial [Prevotella sp.]|nr:hypothetical protein [Prevotella sp.]